MREFNCLAKGSFWVFAALSFVSCSSTPSDDLSMDVESSDLQAYTDEGPVLTNEEIVLSSESVKKSRVLGDGVEIASYKGARLPKIEPKPFRHGNDIINAYYFVRGGESWESLSKLIYGRDDRGQILASWNRDIALAPGSVVYYRSPFRYLDEEKMQHFAADFQIPLQRHTVQSGDWLSKIAGERYGHVESWVEIAIINRDLVPNPDRIEIGQELQVMPRELNTQAILQAFLDKAREATQNAQIAGTVQTPPSEPFADGGEDLNTQVDQQAVDNLAIQASVENLTMPNSLFPSWLKLSTSTLSEIILALIAMVLLVAGYFFVRARRKNRLTEREITVNMDILEMGDSPATPTTRSQHPMN